MWELGLGAGLIPIFLFHFNADANLSLTHPLSGELKLEHVVNAGATAGSGYSFQNQRFASTVVVPVYLHWEIRLGLGAQSEKHWSRTRKHDYRYFTRSFGAEAGAHWNWHVEGVKIQMRVLSLYQPLYFFEKTEELGGDFRRSLFNDPWAPTIDLLGFSLMVAL